MPTARELLEQADALMRRNRKRGKGRLGVPTLTDALGVDRDASLAPTVILPDAPADERRSDRARCAAGGRRHVVRSADGRRSDLARHARRCAGVDRRRRRVAAGHGVARECRSRRRTYRRRARQRDAGAIDAEAGDAFPASAADAEAVAASVQPPAVLEQEPSEPPHEDAPAAPTAPRLDDDFILEIPPSQSDAPAVVADDSPIPPVAGPATLMPGSRDWDALAEEIRMQVLQRLDLFTDTGLREQLGARLSPIVERASAALVETINRELGELVRGYVAEAIEREIESWRNRGA